MEQLIEALRSLPGGMPYAGIFGILFACGLGLPIPEDITLFAGGMLSYYGVTNVYLMIAVGMAGVLVGDTFIFLMGQKFGPKLTRRWPFKKLLPQPRLKEVKKQLHERGKKVIFFARFMPGLRMPIYFTTGTLGIPFRTFFVLDGLASLLSVPLIVYTVFYFGDEVDWVIHLIQRVEHGIIGVALFFVILAVVKFWWKNKKQSARLVALVISGPLLFSCVHSRSNLETPQEAEESQVAEVSSRDSQKTAKEVTRLTRFCDNLNQQVSEMGWELPRCNPADFRIGGFSVQGRPLLYMDIGKPEAANTTLILSMVHGDENTPLYIVLRLIPWLKEHISEFPSTRVVIAPMVNPDGFFRKPRSRVNARGVDVNRNFATADWDASALHYWKKKAGSSPRRFPGKTPESEPETLFQKALIEDIQPNKILSIHAPLNFMDYDGPNVLSLQRFPASYVRECIRLRRQVKAVHGGFYPGSLGNYAGQERGIPTLTLELPTSKPKKAPLYWTRFLEGIRTVIRFDVPQSQITESEVIGRKEFGSQTHLSPLAPWDYPVQKEDHTHPVASQ